MDKHAAEFQDKVKFLMINIEDSADAEKTKTFMERNGVSKSTAAFANSSSSEWFKMSAYPHKALVNSEGKCVANFRFRKVGGEKGDRVGTSDDLNTLL
mmetsp:Transcript_118445/g.209356  ORF Transcript_118445/g.209356 Transcript_118445/m.209356 type:complete len:98 (-) Transcript_118445:248-541(-)